MILLMIPASIRTAMVLLLLLLLVLSGCSKPASSTDSSYAFVGSEGCADCHSRFHELWSSSRHGLAMQPLTPDFIAGELEPQEGELRIGAASFRARLSPEEAWVAGSEEGEEVRYPIRYALGGKNVYYFLTPLERGKLQVLPLAFDVRAREWFDSTASMVRHFADQEDEALDWRERPLTFNSSCYSCHVSQLSTNYDPRDDSYRTEWAEPGINCETCHGPGSEHARVCREAEGGPAPEDLKIILTTAFSASQMNDLCATCHAKMYPISSSFTPGDRFFDHFGLHSLEHQDFYPDGRDLGENYTFTSWRRNPCLADQDFDCVHCHTSSGRNRHAEEPDRACLPCHQGLVDEPEAHTFHRRESEGSRCVSCHMPKTVFARMERHDHSMRPPSPAASALYGSPNACNLCHVDEDAAWADRWVRKWYPSGYQNTVLSEARLVDEARRQEWSRLDRMLEYILSPGRDEIVANSLIRLLDTSRDPAKWPPLRKALSDPSPLIRGSAAASLAGNLESRQTLLDLVEATRDEYRLVRIQAAATLSLVPETYWDSDQLTSLRRATREYEASLRARLDDWSLKYNLGNFYLNQGKLGPALAEYENAHRLNPGVAAPLVNASMVHARRGDRPRAEKSLRQALRTEPENEVVLFNLGLLMAENQRFDEAEALLRKALELEPDFAEAAYNLSVLLATREPAESLHWSRQSYRLQPREPKYAYTLAFYLSRQGQRLEAVEVLEDLIENAPAEASVYALLGSLYEQLGLPRKASALYRRASRDPSLNLQERLQFEARPAQR